MFKNEALGAFLFNGNLTVCAWGKLYEASLWDMIRFPEGKLFEDQYTTYKLIDKADTIVFDPTPEYFYLKRWGSIGHSVFTEKTYELYWGVQEQYTYITEKYPDLSSQMVVAKITWEIVFVNMMLCANKNDKNLIKKLQLFIKENIADVLYCDKINVVRKLQIILFALSFKAYKYMYLTYKKRRTIA